MSNVVRLVNGGSIQVRTGVIQGIGPQGPRGLVGPQGLDGPAGPIGEVGPIGQILAMMGRANISSSNPVAANTDTLLSFGSVAFDDLSCFTSLTSITLAGAGDYQLSCFARFDDAAAGARELWFMVGSAMIARSTRSSVLGTACYADLAHPYRAVAGDVVTVYARASAATAISVGAITVNRLGSGPPGPTGPVGPQGAIGATGPAGPTGPAGTANAGYSTYAQLLPH